MKSFVRSFVALPFPSSSVDVSVFPASHTRDCINSGKVNGVDGGQVCVRKREGINRSYFISR